MSARYLKLFTLVVCVTILTTMSTEAFGWGKGIEGSGDPETRSLDLEDFTEIDLGGAFELEVSFGSRQSVDITVDDNLWDNLEVEVRSGRLTVDWDKSCRPEVDCKIVVVVKQLEEISIHGACEADIEDIQGETFRFNVSGAGDLEINGEVNELEVQISGAGDVDARDLKAKSVDIRISGAGSAEVYASESLKARISGAGDLKYYGDPEDRDTKVSGVGSIKSR